MPDRPSFHDTTSQKYELYTPTGEHCFKDIGIAYYCGEYSPNAHRDRQKLWLPDETEYVYYQHVMQNTSVILMGEPGSGKGAVIYGLRSIMRDEQRPYVRIDGHYQKTDKNDIIHAMDSMLDVNGVVLYDSFDYLRLTTKKIRKLQREKHEVRASEILSNVSDFIEAGGCFVGTAHSDNWETSNLVGSMDSWNTVLARTHIHQVQGHYKDPIQIAGFLDNNNVTSSTAERVAHMPYNSGFQSYIINRWGDSAYVAKIADLMHSYRIQKLLYNHFGPNYDVLNQESEDEVYKNIVDCVLSEDYTTVFFSQL